MKALRTMTCVAALLAASGAAKAADVYNPAGSSKDPVAAALSAPSFWVSAGVGLGSAKATASVPGESLDLGRDGALFDARFGVDRSMSMIAPGWTFGLVGEIANARDVSGTAVGNLWSLGGGVRFGYQLSSNVTPYGIVEYVRQDVSFDGANRSLDGIKLAGGVRYSFANNWFGELEGSWTGLEKTNVSGVNFDNTANAFMVRAGRQF